MRNGGANDVYALCVPGTLLCDVRIVGLGLILSQSRQTREDGLSLISTLVFLVQLEL